MFRFLKGLLFLAWLAPALAPAKPAWEESFRDLSAWEPLRFPKIQAHSVYQSVSLPGGVWALRCESRASASGLVLRQPYDVRAAPVLGFEWKVDALYVGRDPRQKKGDDYPLRIYVFFPLDPAKATWLDQLARSLYGQWPPHSSLNYVWSSTESPGDRPYASPYTSRVRMIPLRSGPTNLGQWMREEVNVLEDYRRAFGRDAPQGPAQLAVMNDSDNTKGASVSWLRALKASAP